MRRIGMRSKGLCSARIQSEHQTAMQSSLQIFGIPWGRFRISLLK